MGLIFVIMLLILVASLILNEYLLYLLVPKPYMDEPFHVKQAQAYCENRFNVWDPKITTPPGLYLVTVLLLKPLTLIFGSEKICSTTAFRCLNTGFLLCLVYVFYKIRRQMQFGSRRSLSAESALIVCTFPLLYFFSLLYYTDTISTLSVFLMYWAFLRNRHGMAASLGLLSISFRQTNIVWVAFCCGNAAFAAIYSNRKRTATKSSAEESILNLVPRNFDDLLKFSQAILPAVLPYFMVFLFFLGFIYSNGGSVAFGDRQAHQVCFHLAQLFYAILFIFCFGFPYAMTKIRDFLSSFVRDYSKYLLAAILIAIGLNYCTFDHPYLLADNRHYTFYVWRRFFSRHWMAKFIPIPIYICASFCILDVLLTNSYPKEYFVSTLRMKVWVFGFSVASLLVTCPNRLIEFRYFIIPYLMWRVHVKATKSQLIFEFLIYLTVNLVTLYLFYAKPFRWPHEPEEFQRFIW